MEIEDLKLITETLGRIQKSLNQRFEKNADLYIPVYEVEKIKDALYEGQYGMILGKLKTGQYPAEVLTKIVVKNAWLVSMPKPKKVKRDFKALSEVMAACDSNFLDVLMKDEVFSNRCDMSKKIRNFLIGSYIDITSVAMCESLLNSKVESLGNPELRVRCLTKLFADNTPQEKYRAIQREAKGHPGILHEINILKKLFKDDLQDIVFQRFLFNVQFSHTESDNFPFWKEIFPNDFYVKIMSYGKEYLENNGSEHNFDKCKKILDKLQTLVIKSEDCRNSFVDCVEVFLKFRMIDASKRNKAINNIYQKTKKNDDLASKLRNIMNAYGIKIQEDSSFPDIEGMIAILDGNYWSEKQLGFLYFAFDSQYDRDVENKINYLYDNAMNEDRVAELLQRLMERRKYKYQYLCYYITKFANDDEDYKNIAMNHIHKNNILREKIKGEAERSIIHDFVKRVNFDLYREWTK